MKISDQITSRDESSPFYTFEFFPPRTDQARRLSIFPALVLMYHAGI